MIILYDKTAGLISAVFLRDDLRDNEERPRGLTVGRYCEKICVALLINSGKAIGL